MDTVQGKQDVDRLLIKSFKELALHDPIEKITIKEITDGAGVIRPTFYNHFQDKYELLERIIYTELLEPVRPLLENRMVNEALLEIMEQDEAAVIRKFKWLTAERIAEYYAQSMCSVVIVWIKSGMAITAKELAEIYDYVMRHSMEEVLFPRMDG